MTYEDRLGDYVQVKDRLVAALKDHPKLAVIESDPTVVQLGDRIFISVTVELYNEENERISRATAWEPFPGRTPYTRDSEQQNASTSALGRALGFLGYGIGKSIATREDVIARSSDEAPPQGIPRPSIDDARAAHPAQLRVVTDPTGAATEKQIGFVLSLAKKRGVIGDDMIRDAQTVIGRKIATLKELTKADANSLIEAWKNAPRIDDGEEPF